MSAGDLKQRIMQTYRRMQKHPIKRRQTRLARNSISYNFLHTLLTGTCAEIFISMILSISEPDHSVRIGISGISSIMDSCLTEMVPKASVAGPANRAEVAVLHAVKALGSAQTNFAGGQGYYNFLTFLAPYFANMPYEEMKQLMQMFVYEMTQMMVARGGQLVFSSVQLSPGVPKLWKDKPCVYKGKVWNGKEAPLQTYGACEREVRLLFKALMEVMLVGDYWGKPFNFPKPEISIEPDFMHEDEEFNKAHPDLPTYEDLYLLTFELASKFGTPYYDNQPSGIS